MVFGGEVMDGEPYWDTILKKIMNKNDGGYNHTLDSAVSLSQMPTNANLKARDDGDIDTAALDNIAADIDADINASADKGLKDNAESIKQNIAKITAGFNNTPNDNVGAVNYEIYGKDGGMENTNPSNYELGDPNKSSNKQGILDHTTAQFMTALGTTFANYGFTNQRAPEKKRILIDQPKRNEAIVNANKRRAESEALARSRSNKTSDATANMLNQQTVTQNSFDNINSLMQQEGQDIAQQKQMNYKQRFMADEVRTNELNEAIGRDNAEALGKDKAEDMLRSTVADNTMRYADAKQKEKGDQRQLAENLFLQKENSKINSQINEISNSKTALVNMEFNLDTLISQVNAGTTNQEEAMAGFQQAVDVYKQQYPDETDVTVNNIRAKLRTKSNQADNQMALLRQQANEKAMNVRAEGAMRGYGYAPTLNQYAHLKSSDGTIGNPIAFKKGGKTPEDYKFAQYKEDLKANTAAIKEREKYDMQMKLQQAKLQTQIATFNIKNIIKKYEQYNKEINQLFGK